MYLTANHTTEPSLPWAIQLIYEVIKGSLAYACGFIKSVFAENDMGKVLVLQTVIVIYNLIL